jgi:glycine cleavage system aminomethyltransferase T
MKPRLPSKPAWDSLWLWKNLNLSVGLFWQRKKPKGFLKSAPPRPGYAIWNHGGDPKKIGEVVSGTQSPSLGLGIGLGYVPPEMSRPGTNLEIEIRGRKSIAQVVSKPIYRKEESKVL